jgi:hypothetical protein
MLQSVSTVVAVAGEWWSFVKDCGALQGANATAGLAMMAEVARINVAVFIVDGLDRMERCNSMLLLRSICECRRFAKSRGGDGKDSEFEKTGFHDDDGSKKLSTLSSRSILQSVPHFVYYSCMHISGVSLSRFNPSATSALRMA